MKIIDLIESRNKTFTLMYHGTSDKFLKSILTYGLLPIGSTSGFKYIKKPKSDQDQDQDQETEVNSNIDLKRKKVPQAEKVPQELKRTYGSDNEEYLSFEGAVYITTDIDMAKMAALSASRIHGGEPILIEIIHLSTSGVLDEDHVFRKFLRKILEQYISHAKYSEYYSDERVAEINKAFISDYKIIQDFLNFVKESIKWGSRMTRKSDLIIKEFFIKAANIFINLFNEVKDGYTPSTCTFACKDNFVEKIAMRDNTLRTLMREFIDTLKVFNPEGPIRITRPITFKGNTRIIRITDLKEQKNFYYNQNYLNSLKQIINTNSTKIANLPS